MRVIQIPSTWKATLTSFLLFLSIHVLFDIFFGQYNKFLLASKSQIPRLRLYIRLNCVYQDIWLNGSENGSLRSVSVFVDAVVK